MKVKVYLRVARGPRGPRVEAGTSPSLEPLTTSGNRPLPTAAFALQLEIPEQIERRPTAYQRGVALRQTAGLKHRAAVSASE